MDSRIRVAVCWLMCCALLEREISALRPADVECPNFLLQLQLWGELYMTRVNVAFIRDIFCTDCEYYGSLLSLNQFMVEFFHLEHHWSVFVTGQCGKYDREKGELDSISMYVVRSRYNNQIFLDWDSGIAESRYE